MNWSGYQMEASFFWKQNQILILRQNLELTLLLVPVKTLYLKFLTIQLDPC